MTGKIYNKETKEKLAGATIILKNNSTVLKNISDDNGEFRFNNIIAGNYSLEINYVGFASYIRKIQVNNKIELNIFLDQKEKGESHWLSRCYYPGFKSDRIQHITFN